MPLPIPRTERYDLATQRRLIINAHSRRHKLNQKQMDKLDRNHPDAYGLSVFNPEVGYLKCTLSNRLAGF
jgi:hypothetical protein